MKRLLSIEPALNQCPCVYVVLCTYRGVVYGDGLVWIHRYQDVTNVRLQ